MQDTKRWTSVVSEDVLSVLDLLPLADFIQEIITQHDRTTSVQIVRATVCDVPLSAQIVPADRIVRILLQQDEPIVA